MVVFDLDPGEEANIVKSCEVAFLVKAVLDKLKLKSLVKVSGSKGIHPHVPLTTNVTYEITKSFAQSIAQFLNRLLQLHGQAAREAAGYLSHKSTRRVVFIITPSLGCPSDGNVFLPHFGNARQNEGRWTSLGPSIARIQRACTFLDRFEP
jgi:hypothetical protein